MRILIVSTNLPVPPNNGQAIRTLSIVRALAAMGHELVFISFASESRPATLDPLLRICREVGLVERARLTNVSEQSDYLRRVQCLISCRSYSIERFRSAAMRARMEAHLNQNVFDLIICDSIYALVNIPQTDVPIALNCHNAEHIIFQRYAQTEENVLRKLYSEIESRLVAEAERRGCHRAAIAMACSENDRELLRRLHPTIPIFVVPNAVDTDSVSGQGPHVADNEAPVLLFQGGMDWYPNRDAVDYFAQRILPLVRAEYPSVRFVVAGRNPAVRFIEKYRNNCNIEFTGTVPDIRPYLSAATVVVVPLRLGSGTRIKILEAGAAGKPIVSTSIGAEGLNLEHGKEILLADLPREFAHSVTQLLRDPARRDSIGSAARVVVRNRYSEAALKTSLEAAVSIFPRDSATIKPAKARIQRPL